MVVAAIETTKPPRKNPISPYKSGFVSILFSFDL